MIATLLIWAYTFCILYAWGRIFRAGLERLFRAEPGELSFPLTCLAGLVLVTTLASALSLALPTGLLVNLLLLSGALTWLVWRLVRHKPILAHMAQLQPLLGVLAVLALLTVLEVATHKPGNPDTGIYHAQAIRWIETYRAVPGLGNLQTRLAYDSSWFVANAVFSLSFLNLRSFHLISSVLFLLALAYFLGGIKDLLQGRITASSLLKTAFFPLAFYLLASDVSSPGTDLPAALLVWVCFALCLERIEARSASFNARDALVVALAAFAVTVKLSTLPVLLLPAGLLLFQAARRDARRTLAVGGLMLLVALPWLARNVVLSGYLVYPGPALDLFQLDWAIPAEAIRYERDWITSWGRLPGLPREEVLRMPLSTWAPLWFANLTGNRKATVLAAALGPALLLVSGLWAWWKARNTADFWLRWRGYLLLYLASIAGVVFWFFSAPAFRFSHGFLMAALLLAVLPALTALVCRVKRLPLLLAAALIGYQGLALAGSVELRTLPARLVLPADYASVPTKPCQIRNLTIFCPIEWQECGYSTFPCVLTDKPDVELRGKTLQDGFRAVR